MESVPIQSTAFTSVCPQAKACQRAKFYRDTLKFATYRLNTDIHQTDRRTDGQIGLDRENDTESMAIIKDGSVLIPSGRNICVHELNITKVMLRFANEVRKFYFKANMKTGFIVWF